MPVMISPANTMVPASGRSTLVIRLKTVDLPAPLGPMMARISPGSTVISTSSTATSAPNRRVRPLHSSSGTGSLLAAAVGRHLGWLGPEPPGQNPPDALRREHDEDDEDRAEDERPQIGDLRQVMFEEDERDSAENRANQGAGPADDHHD